MGIEERRQRHSLRYRDVAHAALQMKARSAMIKHLRRQGGQVRWCEFSQIAKRFDVSIYCVRKYLTNAGTIEKVSRGIYQLAR
jgi:hypothetical protein